jgi:hypothetical protein
VPQPAALATADAPVKVSSESLSRRRFITQVDFVFALFCRNGRTKSGPGPYEMSVQKSEFASGTEKLIWADPNVPDYGNLYHIVAAEAVPERQNIKNQLSS